MQSDSDRPDPAVIGADSAIRFYAVAGKSYIQVGTLKLEIPDSIMITAANIYAGIYELKADFLVRHKFLICKNQVLLCTFDDVGMGYRGYLYVFDLIRKCFISDPDFGRTYLNSSAGIFAVGHNRIFVIDKSQWYDVKQESIIPASLYKVNGRRFLFIRNVYEVGDKSPNDTSGVLSFFKATISPRSQGVFVLPGDWWKVK